MVRIFTYLQVEDRWISLLSTLSAYLYSKAFEVSKDEKERVDHRNAPPTYIAG